MAIVVIARAHGNTSAATLFESIGAFADTRFLAVFVRDNFADLVCATGMTGTGGYVYVTDISVTFESILTSAVIRFLVNDFAVWHAIGIGVTIVVLAWLDGVADFTRTVVSLHTFAVMVTIPSDNS